MADIIVAEWGVRQLQARYVDAVWRKDFEAFGDCFTEDAEWRIAGQLLKGRRCCVEFLQEVMPLFDRVLMSMQNPLLQVTDDSAVGRTYVTELNARKDRRPAFSIGIYYDRFAQQGDRWRYAWHHYQMCYLGPPDASAQFFPFSDYGAPFGMPAHDEPAMAPNSEIF